MSVPEESGEFSYVEIYVRDLPLRKEFEFIIDDPDHDPDCGPDDGEIPTVTPSL